MAIAAVNHQFDLPLAGLYGARGDGFFQRAKYFATVSVVGYNCPLIRGSHDVNLVA